MSNFALIVCESGFQLSDVTSSVVTFSVSYFMSFVFYTLAHWAISYKYWQLSFMLSFSSLKPIERTNTFFIVAVITCQLTVLVI